MPGARSGTGGGAGGGCEGSVGVHEQRAYGALIPLPDAAGEVDPKQSEAFAEFLARQPPVGEQ
ncbi:hypothetical protein [Streptomyces sp. CB03238]|uniref:hypothetical protein n=1 Tax=Streptomyces sp. CB03238 TaxID=1907777 RepID=UPI000A109A83|nr:hypothetical protein [Streptomyces sp. CB03238]ORT59547.1 hypothetical protein BKD26_11565 [Streptomyces sp. CB03238]